MTIKELNEHPLNQAALERLSKEHGDTDPRLIHLLSLAYLGMPDDLDPFSTEGKTLRDWSAGRNLQAAALENLDCAVEADEILESPLKDLAEQIVGTLTAASQS
jgi:hypothetical protein